MRLQLVIQRHSLPPVQVLWTVGLIPPPYATAGASYTVSQLLEQINEAIPLKSEDWGLEDYAVEVRGFECLHFSEINDILRDDDVVSVRPLQTSDVRFRRISGRYQISADGRHLIDGIPFGDRQLQSTDRPPVDIPPRKRRRVSYDQDDDVSGNRGVTFKAGESTSVENDSHDHEEFWPVKEQGQSRITGVDDKYTSYTYNPLAQSPDVTTIDELDKRAREFRAKAGLGIQGGSVLEVVDGKWVPYTRQSGNPISHIGSKHHPPPPKQITTKRRKLAQEPPQSSRDKIELQFYEKDRDGQRKRASNANRESARTQNAKKKAATILDVQDSDRSSDEDFEPGRESIFDLNESDKENSQPNSQPHETRMSPSDAMSSSSSHSSKIDQDDITSPSGSSSGNDHSDPELEQFSPTSDARSNASGNSSPSYTSSSGSDSSTEEPARKDDEKVATTFSLSPVRSDHSSNRSEAAIQDSSLLVQDSSLLNGRKKKTRSNNRRRHEEYQRRMNATLSPNDTALDLQNPDDDGKTTDVSEESSDGSKSDVISYQLRGGSLQQDGASDGEVVSQNSSDEDPSPPTFEATASDNAAVSEGLEDNPADDQPSKDMQAIKPNASEEPDTSSAIATQEIPSINESAPERRSKFHPASRRRTIFGSLRMWLRNS